MIVVLLDKLGLSSNFNYFRMGCVSETGCLGPRKRQRQVYAQLIEQIHLQAKKVQFSDNLNIYSSIREKIMKKGQIRKLLDNLSSHRTKIHDSLNHNLRIVTQAQELESKYAGLIILNEMVSNLYKDKVGLENAIPDNLTVARSNSSQGKMLKNVSQQAVGFGIDMRFDLFFFRTVLHLLETQGRMYLNVLESINTFCVGKKDKLACKNEVWRALQIILQRLQRGNSVEESCQTYLNLLEQLKQGGKEESTHQKDILAFMKLWMANQSLDDQISSKQQRLKNKYQRIIKLFVDRCMSSWDAKVLFRTMFVIYDEQKFIESKIRKFQMLILNIVIGHDLHSHILRGLFIYLLEYLSISFNAIKTSFRASLSDQFQNVRYPHIKEKATKIKAFETLRRWGSKKYINLNDSVSFSSSALVHAYISNLTGERDYIQEVVRQFYKLAQQLNRQSNLIIINLLIEQIKWQNTDQSVRRLLIHLIRQIIQANRLLQGPLSQQSNLFILIEEMYTRDTRLQLIQLTGYIIKHLSLEQIMPREDSSNSTTMDICEFFASIYDGMVHIGNETIKKNVRKQEDDDMLYRFQFANAVISFMKCFIDKSAYSYIIAFLSSLIAKIASSEIDIPNSKLVLYFQIYVLQEGIHLVMEKQKISDKMASINFRITASLRSNELKPQMEGFVNQMLGINGESAQRFAKINLSVIEQLISHVKINAEEYRLMSSCFSNYFNSNRMTYSKSFAIEISKSSFKRESVNGSYYESHRDRSRLDDDESFKDIMQRIVVN